MTDDVELLRCYAEKDSEAAFAALVQQRVDFVYSIALRQVAGDVHLAQDVVQQVFTDLARKAQVLVARPTLTGWLCRSTHFAASDAVRRERRRRAREQEAHAMEKISAHAPPAPDWDKFRPLLDAAIAGLEERDRDAVTLRFFDARPFAEIGTKLRLNENAARMRVERALDKLRRELARRGVTSTTTALALALANQPIAAAPAGLATTVTSAALAAGGVAAVAGATLGASGSAATGGVWATFMSMTKLQLGISAVLAAGAGIGLVLQARSNAQLRDEVAALRQENANAAALRAENEQLQRTVAEVAALHGDDAKLARLSDDAAALKVRLQHLEKAETAPPAAWQTIKQPRILSNPAPEYPPELRAAGVGGTVLVDFVVDSTGTVRNPAAVAAADGPIDNVPANAIRLEKVVVGSTSPSAAANEAPGSARLTEEQAQLLAEAAVRAVGQWIFDPALMGPRKVNTQVQVPVEFNPGGTR
jgi:RNA polymerase sigma factor (sigma-70 family)